MSQVPLKAFLHTDYIGFIILGLDRRYKFMLTFPILFSILNQRILHTYLRKWLCIWVHGRDVIIGRIQVFGVSPVRISTLPSPPFSALPCRMQDTSGPDSNTEFTQGLTRQACSLPPSYDAVTPPPSPTQTRHPVYPVHDARFAIFYVASQ